MVHSRPACGLACALVVLGACSKPSPPTIKPERATLTSIGPAGVGVHLELEATNPNSVSIAAREVTAHVVLDKKYDLGTTTLPSVVTLAANKATQIDAPLMIAWNDVAALMALGAANRPVPYTVDGTLALGGDMVSVTVPYHLEGTIQHEDFVRATLGALPNAIPGLPAIPGLTAPAAAPHGPR
jgi:hypothetical protein